MESESFDAAIQALLDGRPVSDGTGPSAGPSDALHLMDAIARAHRTLLFGHDRPIDGAVTRWLHLEMRREIGRGASGTVYRAWDSRLQREVALKLLAREELDEAEALAEGRLLARLNHPHIVRVFGADAHEGVAGIWMELLEGDTLDDILARDGEFSVEETLLIGLDLARALAAVHGAGLLHRDIKARNVLRERGGRIVLMDLGAGRTADTSDGSDTTGTPMYMAPEVLAGAPATVRSDIYCLGVLLYRLLTRDYPVAASDLAALRDAHKAAGRTALQARRSDVPPIVCAAIERACHPDAAERFTTSPEFEVALADALHAVVRERYHVPSRLQRKFARHRRTLHGAVLAAAVVLIMLPLGWDTTAGRAARRAVGLQVPPLSPLYISMNGAIGIIRGRSLEVFAGNPGPAVVLAASTDDGIRTRAGIPGWNERAAYELDGTPKFAAAIEDSGPCCFGEGTTDGAFNYAPRTDSTLLQPIGSRPLAPSGLYRFDRDWANPRLHFPLDGDGLYYGAAYDRATQTFWLTRRLREGARIEHWGRDGQRLPETVDMPTGLLLGIAADPADGTLWVVHSQIVVGAIRLENFDRTGRHLGSVDVARPIETLDGAGAEFVWVAHR